MSHQRARQLAREGAFDVLITLEPARIWRDSDEMTDDRRRFKKHGLTFEYVNKQVVSTQLVSSWAIRG